MSRRSDKILLTHIYQASVRILDWMRGVSREAFWDIDSSVVFHRPMGSAALRQGMAPAFALPRPCAVTYEGLAHDLLEGVPPMLVMVPGRRFIGFRRAFRGTERAVQPPLFGSSRRN